MVWFYNPGISWASPVWGPTGAGGAVLSELEVLRVRRCSLKGRVIIFHINLQIPPSSNYRAWVMTILISYDKFTQYYRDLAEHSLLIVSSSCVTTLPWPHSELKKKKKLTAKTTGKWSYAGSSELFSFFRNIYDLGSQQIGKFILRILTSWHVSAGVLEWRELQCSIAL